MEHKSCILGKHEGVFLSLVAILTTLVEEGLRFHSRGALLVQGVLLESPV